MKYNKNETPHGRLNSLGVDVILTFEQSVPEDISKLMDECCFNGQQIYQQIVTFLTKEYRSFEKNPKLMVNGIYSCEKHILSQIIPNIEEELKPYLLKISLWFFRTTPKLNKKLHKGLPLDREDIQKKSLSIYKKFLELSDDEKLDYSIKNKETEDEYSFIKRSESKYYFQPDQRNFFTKDIVKTFGISDKVLPIGETTLRHLPDKPQLDYFKNVSFRNIITGIYFGGVVDGVVEKGLKKEMSGWMEKYA